MLACSTKGLISIGNQDCDELAGFCDPESVESLISMDRVSEDLEFVARNCWAATKEKTAEAKSGPVKFG